MQIIAKNLRYAIQELAGELKIVMNNIHDHLKKFNYISCCNTISILLTFSQPSGSCLQFFLETQQKNILKR